MTTTTTVTLPSDQLAQLKLLALKTRRSLDEVIRDAVTEYLAQLPDSDVLRVTEPPPGPPDPEWRADMQERLARIHAGVLADLTPEEIEHEITLASEEARQERIAARERELRGG